MHRADHGVCREKLLKGLLLWRLDARLASYYRSDFGRRSKLFDHGFDVCRFDGIDDKIGDPGHGVSIHQWGY
jgi:hypothetical protein